MAWGDPEVTSNHVIQVKPEVSPSEVTHAQQTEFLFVGFFFLHKRTKTC